MKFQAKLITSSKDLGKAISFTLKKHIDKNLPKVQDSLTTSIRDIITDSFKNSKEYNSLLNGELKADFGLDNPQNRVNGIIYKWANTFVSNFSPVTIKDSKLKFKASIDYIRSDFQDVINMVESNVFSSGGTVEWLKWLLLEGDRIIINNYFIQYNLDSNSKKFSRTGEALMRQKPGTMFKVNPSFAGNINNNWTTRVINNIGADIEIAMQKALEKIV